MSQGTSLIGACALAAALVFQHEGRAQIVERPVPGDPVTVRADFGSNHGYDAGAVVDSNGDILVSDLNMKIWRISQQGAKSNVAAAVEFPAGLAWDADMPVKPLPDGMYPRAIPGKTKVV